MQGGHNFIERNQVNLEWHHQSQQHDEEDLVTEWKLQFGKGICSQGIEEHMT
jgi:hypothetical protein